METHLHRLFESFILRCAAHIYKLDCVDLTHLALRPFLLSYRAKLNLKVALAHRFFDHPSDP